MIQLISLLAHPLNFRNAQLLSSLSFLEMAPKAEWEHVV